ncbi:pyruvate dehydrogenase (acetyl-transferring) E1 component subunit alpha [Hymenobacter metallicola]|uniref:Pyruvate dehydrogenase E1 component subunit alpha n=1 Tax=Hymenobacter metallicola TaxID=2563114 RepID=A0A4Z0QAY6_9BACT|nr:pyruvate dehydrogenase (acetyl-transferring) E1 component subunit alpha [Hymenobacter metallicola]TGE26616.1 pyruvate dehydrogenase (acetyl-transferring) E1 component subunit alpha [Hymenobacter metallicola]
MAETKVKATPSASNSAKKSSNKKTTPKADGATDTVKQPDPVLPPTHDQQPEENAPRATSPAEPQFPKETYLTWYEQMQLMRKFEEKAGQLYGQQKIKGFCHLYIGQEACVAGAVSALQKGDKWITAYRDHAHPLALGTSPNAIMAELYAKATGCSKGKGGSMHMFDKEVNFVGGHGIVGGQVPMGAGLAFAEKYNKTGNLCICYMGDGAVRQGALHEAFNMAMLWKLPVIFVVENNGYAMGTSVQRTSNVTELYHIGRGYDMPSEPVNGMNVEDIHDAVARAAERARAGEGPTFLEFKTYRYKGHSMSDPAKYRTKEELEDYRSRDAIESVRHTILTHNMATEEELTAIDEKIKAQVQESVEFAENSPFPTADELYKDVYVQQDYPYIRD